MPKKTRKELQREFHQQLYISASMFKMKSFSNGEKPEEKLDPTKLEERVNNSVNFYHLRPFPHPQVETQVIPEREPWSKMKQKNLLKDADEIQKHNAANSNREEKKDA